MGRFVSILILMLLTIIGLSMYFIYDNLPGENEQMLISSNPAISIELQNLSQIKQFYPNIRFNHNNISYNYSSDCSHERIEKIQEAFNIISSKTKIITFFISDKADIQVSCSQESIEKDSNTFIAGEGGPREYINSTIFPVILSGKILLYQESSCKQPIVEIHELLHVFGFDHLNEPGSIMYPYADCNQELRQEHINYLINLYSIEPKSEIFFEQGNVTKSGKYLNFEIFVLNKGIIDAENVKLTLTENNEMIKEFELGKIQFGSGKKFIVENLKLNSRNSENIKLTLSTSSAEYDKENNILSATSN